MYLYFSVIIFVLGLCLGSFVNMWEYRTARKYNLRRKPKSLSPSGHLPLKKGELEAKENRSYCDFCGKQLHWYENIPVVSWLIQGGKSRCCGKKLPWEYSLVELGTGILLLLNFKFLIFNFQSISNLTILKLILSLVVITVMMYETVFDIKYMILPETGLNILIGTSLFLVLISPDYLTRAAAGGLSWLFVWGLSKIKIRGKTAMGDGDAPLAGFMGWWLGFPNIIVAFYVAFIIGAIVGVGLIWGKIKKRDDAIPFGPFLMLGTVVAWWWGEKIVKMILK